MLQAEYAQVATSSFPADRASIRCPTSENRYNAKAKLRSIRHGASYFNSTEAFLQYRDRPGTGKTYTGARLICELVRAGKKVGITANSHKVIRNLLDMAVEAASEEDVDIKIIQKVSGKPNREPADPIQETNTNNTVLTQLAMGTANVAAGTAWLWSRTEFNETVDVLIVDEAGQMSLANALAISQGAKNLVLLGDPQQLQQPQQASHPDGTEVSALKHLLGGSKTIPDDRGIFIAETRRPSPLDLQLHFGTLL